MTSGRKVTDLLPVVRKQAETYEVWTTNACGYRSTAQPGRARDLPDEDVGHRVAETIADLAPRAWPRGPRRRGQARVTSAAESWLVRRQILRMSVADMGRIVADIIRAYERTPLADLAESVEGHLLRLNVASTYWPGDDELREELRTQQVFRRIKESSPPDVGDVVAPRAERRRRAVEAPEQKVGMTAPAAIEEGRLVDDVRATPHRRARFVRGAPQVLDGPQVRLRDLLDAQAFHAQRVQVRLLVQVTLLLDDRDRRVVRRCGRSTGRQPARARALRGGRRPGNRRDRWRSARACRPGVAQRDSTRPACQLSVTASIVRPVPRARGNSMPRTRYPRPRVGP